jgi:AbrB family looped-hinge helix DNA binding protein
METTITSKGQVTIPKHLRDSMNFQPGCKVTWDVTSDGDPILRKCGPVEEHKPDRFDKVAGTAEIKLGCSTDEYTELIRGYSNDPD